MNQAATAEKPAGTEKEKGPAPVIRGITMAESGWQETIVLWPTKDGAGADLRGFVLQGTTRRNVLGFINTNTEKGTKFLTLKESVQGQEKMNTVGHGNPINTHKDGSPVYFDTLAFNIGDTTVFGRLTKAATAELQKELGFTSTRLPRPQRAENEPESEGDSTAQRPRA